VLSGLMTGLTNSTCRGWFMFDLIIEMVSLWSTTLIITLRVRALWADRKDVARFLQTVWILHVFGSLGLTVNSIVKNQVNYSFNAEIGICFGTVLETWTIWIPAMVLHAVIFVMLIWKTLYTPRDDHTKLLTILLVDGFTYFAVVFAVMLANLLIWAVGSPMLAQLPHYSVWAISTLAVTRLLLSLQKRFHTEADDLFPSEHDDMELSDVGMAKPGPHMKPALEQTAFGNFYSYYSAPFPVLDIRREQSRHHTPASRTGPSFAAYYR